MIVSLGPKMKTAATPTRIFFSDDICCWYDWNNQVQTRVATNRVADSVASIRAMHYAADNDNGSVSVFNEYGTGARSLGKQAWNTEFGNGPDTWDGAWKNVKDMYFMLNRGFSGIVYWLLGPHTSAGQQEESVMYNLRRGPKAYAVQAFARYVRPGAVRLGVTSSDQSIWTLAFRHAERNMTTVLLINTGTGANSASVSGVTLPAGAKFSVYQTSASQNCVRIGEAAVGETVSLTGRSVTTLVYDPQGGTSARRSAARAREVAASRSQERWYGLDGRVGTSGAESATGVRCVLQGDGIKARAVVR